MFGKFILIGKDMNVVYENDEFVICEITEVAPIYEDETYVPSYLDIIHVSYTKRVSDSEMCIRYYFKLIKAPKISKHIEPLSISLLEGTNNKTKIILENYG